MFYSLLAGAATVTVFSLAWCIRHSSRHTAFSPLVLDPTHTAGMQQQMPPLSTWNSLSKSSLWPSGYLLTRMCSATSEFSRLHNGAKALVTEYGVRGHERMGEKG